MTTENPELRRTPEQAERLRKTRIAIIIGTLILALMIGWIGFGIANGVASQYTVWLTVQPTQARTAPLKNQLIFPSGWEPFTCAKNGAYTDCQWICRNILTGDYRECTPIIATPAPAPGSNSDEGQTA